MLHGRFGGVRENLGIHFREDAAERANIPVPCNKDCTQVNSKVCYYYPNKEALLLPLFCSWEKIKGRGRIKWQALRKGPMLLVRRVKFQNQHCLPNQPQTIAPTVAHQRAGSYQHQDITGTALMAENSSNPRGSKMCITQSFLFAILPKGKAKPWVCLDREGWDKGEGWEPGSATGGPSQDPPTAASPEQTWARGHQCDCSGSWGAPWPKVKGTWNAHSRANILAWPHTL